MEDDLIVDVQAEVVVEESNPEVESSIQDEPEDWFMNMVHRQSPD